MDLNQLRTIETQLHAELKNTKDLVAQTRTLKRLAKVQKRAALLIFDDPTAWARRFRQDHDI